MTDMKIGNGRLGDNVSEFSKEGPDGLGTALQGARWRGVGSEGDLGEQKFCQNLPKQPASSQNLQNKFWKGGSPENIFLNKL